MKKVYNAQDEIEANMLENALEDAGIAAFSRESGSGEYMKIVSGFSVYGRDIFVEDENEDEAKKIIKEVLEENRTELEDKYYVPWYKNKVIVARVIIGWCVLLGIIMVVLTNL